MDPAAAVAVSGASLAAAAAMSCLRVDAEVPVGQHNRGLPCPSAQSEVPGPAPLWNAQLPALPSLPGVNGTFIGLKLSGPSQGGSDRGVDACLPLRIQLSGHVC